MLGDAMKSARPCYDSARVNLDNSPSRKGSLKNCLGLRVLWFFVELGNDYYMIGNDCVGVGVMSCVAR
jgi:hypothetical protein